MTEDERIHAIPILSGWKRSDPTVNEMVMCVLRAHNLPSVGHLARYQPEAFDDLYEEAEAMTQNFI